MHHLIDIKSLFRSSIILALAIAASLVTSAVVASRAYQNRAVHSARAQQELTVKGSARLPVRSDLAVWHITVSGDGPQLQAAYEVLEFGIDRVQAFLQEQGFADAQIGLGAIHTQIHQVREKDGRDTMAVAGYSLTRSFRVTTAEVDRVSRAAGEVTQLLKENVRVSSSPPEYSYTKVADLKVQILGEASKDARTRAMEIATNSGCQVGQVRKAHMGVIQITQPNSTDVSGYGIYDTSTIDKDISVVVTVTFGIES